MYKMKVQVSRYASYVRIVCGGAPVWTVTMCLNRV